MLRFQLEGFSGVLVGVTVEPGAESRVVQRLEVAPVSETVDVSAPAPVEKPRPTVPPPAPSPPRAPLLKPVPAHDRDSVCGPAKPGAAPESLGTIRSQRYVAEGGLYTRGIAGHHRRGQRQRPRRGTKPRGPPPLPCQGARRPRRDGRALRRSGADCGGQRAVVDCPCDLCLRRAEERRFSRVVHARTDSPPRAPRRSRVRGSGPDSFCR